MLCRLTMKILRHVCMFSSVCPVEVHPESSQSSTEISPFSIEGGPQKSEFFPWHCHQKLFRVFPRVSVAVFHIMNQNLTQMRCFLQPLPRKWWIALHTHNNEHPLTAMQTVMAAAHRTDSNDADSYKDACAESCSTCHLRS